MNNSTRQASIGCSARSTEAGAPKADGAVREYFCLRAVVLGKNSIVLLSLSILLLLSFPFNYGVMDPEGRSPSPEHQGVKFPRFGPDGQPLKAIIKSVDSQSFPPPSAHPSQLDLADLFVH